MPPKYRTVCYAKGKSQEEIQEKKWEKLKIVMSLWDWDEEKEDIISLGRKRSIDKEKEKMHSQGKEEPICLLGKLAIGGTVLQMLKIFSFYHDRCGGYITTYNCPMYQIVHLKL